jgi:hypothetical protein
LPVDLPIRKDIATSTPSVFDEQVTGKDSNATSVTSSSLPQEQPSIIPVSLKTAIISFLLLLVVIIIIILVS